MMKTARQIDSTKLNLRPKCYDDSRAIWLLKHFSALRDDFVESFREYQRISKKEKLDTADYDLLKIFYLNCEAFKELVYLISQLSLIDVNKESYAGICDYEEFALNIYQNDKKKKRKLTSKYAASSLGRYRRTIACFIETNLNEHPNTYKHLEKYMRNAENKGDIL